MIIAVDFDGTIVEHDYPRIGKPIDGAIDGLKRLKELGHFLILWTVREDHPGIGFTPLKDAISYLKNNGVTIDVANKTPEVLDFRCMQGFPKQRKVIAEMFIDDRNFGGFPGWEAIMEFFEEMGKVETNL